MISRQLHHLPLRAHVHVKFANLHNDSEENWGEMVRLNETKIKALLELQLNSSYLGKERAQELGIGVLF